MCVMPSALPGSPVSLASRLRGYAHERASDVKPGVGRNKLTEWLHVLPVEGLMTMMGSAVDTSGSPELGLGRPQALQVQSPTRPKLIAA